ncbi:PAS fold [Raoultella terrigena]|uniref:PAS fold n=1 Tax=Raoultella terrigena TaxID=577 RepID=A0A3P8M4S3_RAOTE|nr:PAS fold [Raoultella terrigena]
MLCVTEADPAREPVDETGLAVDELSQICEGLARQRPENMPALLNALALIAPLLNAIPNVVFFIKDHQARYLLANLTLARRCGFKTVSMLLGKTSADVFPSALGQGYTEQDLRVLREGVMLARPAGDAPLQRPRTRLVPDAEAGAARYSRAGDWDGRDLTRSAGGPRPPSGVAAAGDRSTIIFGATIIGRSRWMS